MDFKHICSLVVVKGFQFGARQLRPGDEVCNLDFPKPVFQKLLEKNILKLKGENPDPIRVPRSIFVVDPDDVCRLNDCTLDQDMDDLISFFSAAPHKDDDTTQFLTLSPLEFPILLENGDDVYTPCPTTEFGRELLAYTESSAECFSAEFVQLLRSQMSRDVANLQEGEVLDDLIATQTTGRCWSREESVDVPGFDVSIVLDFSGSVFTDRSKLFTRICQAGYFIHRMAYHARNQGFPMDSMITLFATNVVILPPKMHSAITCGFDWEAKARVFKRGVRGGDIHEPLLSLSRKLGGSTSLFSAAHMGLKAFHPRNKGILFLLTDVVPNETYVDKLNALDIPESVTPVYVNLGRWLSPILGKTAHWTIVDVHNPQEEMLNTLMDSFREKLVDIFA